MIKPTSARYLLPTEIWTTTLESLDAASLSALCLVSQLFRDMAQPRLFSRVHLLLPGRFEIPDPEDVRDEDLRVDDDDASFDRDSERWTSLKNTITHFEQALSHNPRLALAVSSLVLDSLEYYELTDTTAIPLQAIRSMVNLKSLTIRDDISPHDSEEGQSVINRLVDILCNHEIEELVLHCLSHGYDIFCGFSGHLARFRTVKRIEWIPETPATTLHQELAPMRALLLASQQSLTTICFPLSSELPQSTHTLLCDLTFPHLRSLTLGPYGEHRSQNVVHFLELEARFTKFLIAHPLLELLDLYYATNSFGFLTSWPRNAPGRPSSPRLVAQHLTRDSLPRLRRFRGNIESILAMDQAGVSSLAELEELGIGPLNRIHHSLPDTDALTSTLQTLLCSPRKPEIRVLHIDWSWDQAIPRDVITNAIALSAQLWGDSLHTWAGTFPVGLQFEQADTIRMFGGFTRLKTIYLPPQYVPPPLHARWPGKAKPIAKEGVIRLLAQASTSLERVRIEKKPWICPLAEPRERGLLTWDEWRISRDIISMGTRLSLLALS